MSVTDQLISSYTEWFRQNISAEEIKEDIIEITSPFLDRHNDFLQIYATIKDGKIHLTDDGFIINDLAMSGCSVDNTPRRKEIFQSILNGYGVKRSYRDELYVSATFENFPQRKHMLLQAMMAINDMFMTSHSNVSTIFFEEVEKFFIENGIRYSDQISLTGKIGLTHTYDFIISGFKETPDRLISTVNNPSPDRAKIEIFGWNEIKDTRRRPTSLYVFLNDKNKQIAPDIIAAFDEYGITGVPWSQRNQYTEELSA